MRDDSGKNLARQFSLNEKRTRAPPGIAVTAGGRKIELENKHYHLLIDIGRECILTWRAETPPNNEIPLGERDSSATTAIAYARLVSLAGDPLSLRAPEFEGLH